ncbi:peroxidase-related enzyme [Deinococcus radiodurans]|jgi:alkylhydroperoxidase AhpD family core domain|nr:peroxidase-related enzyme [Deinococcus radiodurans]ANC71138.1 alkylhydroperoxidase [Deinococcus radiodurans R1 = ATCC 13939 = DSM 20539]QIP29730.1 peroxidase-related enzyme [Deinococcus radiodurans]QIP31593.1 peroxidase-related enzyme [Deinococcus radiodurans]UID70740.1 alkylhydroperoxidase [Deinococcus radiodurans R1 = ATCC 13939 = DSM 20539]UTA51152.1 peroxidase-related enzyme [Deinococcus radiodurans]
MPTTQPRLSFLAVPTEDNAHEGVKKLWSKAEANMGFVPNVFRAQALNGEQFLAWWNYFNLLVNKEGGLSNAERELLAVVVSGLNRCVYCAVSHGAALREFSGDAVKADAVAVNWRQAELSEREQAMCAYAEKLTLRPAEMTEADLAPLRAAGLSDEAILEAVQVIAMFNMTNRVSSALGFVPNPEYHIQSR